MPSNQPIILNNIRLIGRTTEYLDRKLGSQGEVFYDKDEDSLRIFDGARYGGFAVARKDLVASSDLSNVSDDIFRVKANSAGVTASTTVAETPPTAPNSGELWFDVSTGSLLISYDDGDSQQWVQPANIVLGGGGSGGSGNTFTSFAVSGQNTVTADSPTDTLTLVAGSGVTITTNSATDTITISASGGGGGSGNSFTTIAVTGTTSLTADSSTDTLTFTAGAGISLSTDEASDTITISALASSPTFATLADAPANFTIDEVYLPAITKVLVTNTGSTAYLFDQYAGNNPTLYAISGTTIAFGLNCTGHPFQIQDGTGTNYNTGLVHVSTTGTVSTGASAQGKDSGTLYWKLPASISGTYRYQCSSHVGMVGGITVKNIVSI